LPADPVQALTEAPAAAPSPPAVNGRYEQTYFRGVEDAAVTIIDYSDFL
jgi:hypothetical protein